MKVSMHTPKNTEMGICHKSTKRNSRRRRAICTSTRKHCHPSMNVPKLTAVNPRESTLGVAEMGELPKSAFTTMSMPSPMTAMPASISAMRPVRNRAARSVSDRSARAAGEPSADSTEDERPPRAPSSKDVAFMPPACGEGLSDGSADTPERSRPMDFPLARISLPRLIFRSVIVSSPSFPVSKLPLYGFSYSTEKVLTRRKYASTTTQRLDGANSTAHRRRAALCLSSAPPVRTARHLR